MVFDDASQWYAETKASFNAIFPFLRSGGYYIIEDWGWAHWPGDRWQKDGGIWSDRPALSNLIIELVMLCATVATWLQTLISTVTEPFSGKAPPSKWMLILMFPDSITTGGKKHGNLFNIG